MNPMQIEILTNEIQQARNVLQEAQEKTAILEQKLGETQAEVVKEVQQKISAQVAAQHLQDQVQQICVQVICFRISLQFYVS